MIRTVEQWEEILNEGGLFPRDAARRILGDITHYHHGGVYEADDIQQLANALVAYQSHE